MKLYTFSETLVTLITSHATIHSVHGTQGTLATTFLAFVTVLIPKIYYVLINFSRFSLPTIFHLHLCSFKPGIWYKHYGFDYAHLID